ncbi:GGDEF domain-containing protein [Paenibacillus ihbetae]|uniref:Diguanylate cyclase n=1 Tax=Paenibacillus ihbetae TaxID=1870820 RepID=A0A1B2E5D7_9BACL|nr:GGDEF domain-containing protein [Paenibacillus ihbetae]ANY75122.1 diguanylate cyclase [Paenibacillus ihbetae]OOC62712.1 GGDEF domain-containing protein [Paenibacillus ihbetae]
MSTDLTSWSTSPLPIVFAVCGACIAFMMLIMCLFMYSRQRKSAYIYMAAAFSFIMTHEGLNIHSAWIGIVDFSPEPIVLRIIRLFSFVLLNMSVVMLYRKIKTMHYWLPLLTAALLLLPLLLPSFLPFTIDPVWQSLYFDFILLSALYTAFTKGVPRIGQPVKYAVGLAAYALWFALQAIQTYTGIVSIPVQGFALALPVLFYTLVFFILFRRIVELMQSIYRSAITDGLTGLYNRRHFMKYLDHYTAQALKISAIFCDIDNFKKLNDTHGHARADEVLKQVAAIMEEELDGIGITGRYGGEELVALVVDRRIKPSQVAENIRARVAAETIVTISVGYSVLRQGVQGDELMDQADKAMYHSKTTGKNKVTDYRSLEDLLNEPKEAAVQ